MDRVFSESQNPQMVIKYVGVAIERVPHGRHLGVVYRQEDEWRILHLGWHLRLYDERMPKEGSHYLWVDPEPAIDEIRLEILAAFCRLVAQRNVDAGLPYGFSNPKNWFDPVTGAARVTSDGMGLTCASFVLAVFSSNGLPLINEDTWMLREDDKIYHEWIIQCLENTPEATKEHRERLRESLPAIRYRPEEVAGAAACDPIPADFSQCRRMGVEILGLLI
jgi:hypothetical protein